jgi:aryl-alcohol dehydrogenase-like predicted oxidoreductase
VWSPLAAGFLTGRYLRENPQGNGGRLSGFDIIPFDRERGYDVVARLKVIDDSHGTTPAQIALAWLLAKLHVTSVLMGASREDRRISSLTTSALWVCNSDQRKSLNSTR